MTTFLVCKGFSNKCKPVHKHTIFWLSCKCQLTSQSSSFIIIVQWLISYQHVSVLLSLKVTSIIINARLRLVTLTTWFKVNQSSFYASKSWWLLWWLLRSDYYWDEMAIEMILLLRFLLSMYVIMYLFIEWMIAWVIESFIEW